jgi:hypothetical protein
MIYVTHKKTKYHTYSKNLTSVRIILFVNEKILYINNMQTGKLRREIPFTMSMGQDTLMIEPAPDTLSTMRGTFSLCILP